MKSRAFFNWLIILLGVIAITSFCFTPAFADESRDDMEIQDETFGEGYQMTWIPIESFIPTGSDTEWYTTDGYTVFLSETSKLLRANINLPSGAYVVHARFFYYDNDADGDVFCHIFRFEYPNSYTLLTTFTSSGTPGHHSYYLALNHIIRNRNGAYSVVLGATKQSYALSVGGVRLMWKRQISPAPASATFIDVGPGHWAFQSVEALAASGITQGCPDCVGCFCPDKPVSRAAMAAFLARALGLHWDSLDGY